MKFKHLIFALLTAASASSFTGCNESTPNPKPEVDCVTCEDEHIVSEIIDYEGVIVSVPKQRLLGQDTVSRAISISKGDPFTFSKDSVLVPCPNLSEEFQTLGEKVIISGYIKSCDRLLTHPNVHTIYARKFDLKNIKKR
ncbi:MAG: hypothetical protein COZ18_03365 [Flexibacter sp. CG_4_10_14_3_um_filter_32_15]|nr:MAG: hypothetical protein COZ18_03365 [Flexibacter sp. CG_4_10_14_3_um_filter_32_15]